MSCNGCDVGNCWGRIVVQTLFESGVFILLLPGFVFTFYPEKSDDPLTKRIFFTGKINWQSVLIHAAIYLIISFLFFILIEAAWTGCPLSP